jgi:hypothetical protein
VVGGLIVRTVEQALGRRGSASLIRLKSSK